MPAGSVGRQRGLDLAPAGGVNGEHDRGWQSFGVRTGCRTPQCIGPAGAAMVGGAVGARPAGVLAMTGAVRFEMRVPKQSDWTRAAVTPFTVVLDIATSPVQLLVVAYTLTAWR